MLFALCVALRPVVLIPGTFASILDMTSGPLSSHWYCPKQMTDTVAWINDALLVPPRYNCMVDFITNTYNAATDEVLNYANSTFTVRDFGGLSGISHIDSLFKKRSFIPYYEKLIEHMTALGYVERKTLFGAPFDWRTGLHNQTVYYSRLKKLVEEAYAQNNKQKVVLVGHSLGSFITHQFLSVAMSQAWVNQYIYKSVLIAPSMIGSGEAVHVAWNHAYKLIIDITSPALSTLFQNSGAVHVHFPNFEVFEDDTLIVGPDGTKYKAKDFPQLLINHGKLTGDGIMILQKNLPYISKFPKASHAPCRIIYNSGRPTQLGINFNQGWDKDGEPINVGGDTTIPSIGVERYCSRYSGTNLKCYDLKDPNKTGNHFAMILNPDHVEYIYSIIAAAE